MDEDRSTTAESINARIERSVPFIRYVKGENLIPFLNIRFALLNIATRYRRKHATEDLEDADIWAYFKDTVMCSCDMCTVKGAMQVSERDMREYVDASSSEKTGLGAEGHDETQQPPSSRSQQTAGRAQQSVDASDEPVRIDEDSDEGVDAMLIEGGADFDQPDAPDHVVTETFIARTNVPTANVEILDGSDASNV